MVTGDLWTEKREQKFQSRKEEKVLNHKNKPPDRHCLLKD